MCVLCIHFHLILNITAGHCEVEQLGHEHLYNVSYFRHSGL